MHQYGWAEVGRLFMAGVGLGLDLHVFRVIGLACGTFVLPTTVVLPGTVVLPWHEPFVPSRQVQS